MRPAKAILDHGPWPDRPEPKAARRARQLHPDEIERLVNGYEQGKTVYELADELKIHRESVSRHLRRQGVVMRGQGLSDKQVSEAARLYEQGWSLEHLGAQFTVDGETVRLAFIARGIPRRKPHDRE